MKKILSILSSALLLACCCSGPQAKVGERWSVEKAKAWYAEQPYLMGCDYIPATAINQIEMWSSDTYDRPTIESELSLAHETGFNTLRVFLSSVVWQNDPEGFKSRVDEFLSECSKNEIKPMFVFLDDCWNEESEYGTQPEPVVGRHNSGWVQDPSCSRRADTVTLYKELHAYVADVMGTFKNDERILLWDLYNEPGNRDHNLTSKDLLLKMFQWAREVNPSQPISVGVWTKRLNPLNAISLENSDIITYHDYKPVDKHRTAIEYLEMLDRPLICTEYMARTHDSFFQTVLPMMKEKNVGAINWGFVEGKTNTKYSWELEMPGGEDPDPWFHDIYRADHTPYCQEEVDLIKSIRAK